MAEAPLSERQKKYFAALRASLERDTGRSMAEWVEIARACPETAPRARLKWFKEAHGLLQNRASQVLAEAFGGRTWEEPGALLAALWTDPAACTIYAALDDACHNLEGTIRTPRKAYTAWARAFQYAATRPIKGGAVELGLAVDPALDTRLQPPKNAPWSERLKAVIRLTDADEADGVTGLLRAAWERS